MLRGFSCALYPSCIVHTCSIKALTERSYFCKVHHRRLHPRMETKAAFETLRWHRLVVFYQASIILIEQRNYTERLLCFYSIVLSVSAVYYNCHQVRILVQKQKKKEEVPPYKHWVESYCKIYDYKSKLPNVYEEDPLTFHCVCKPVFLPDDGWNR
jgi:hypothetical protein